MPRSRARYAGPDAVGPDPPQGRSTDTVVAAYVAGDRGMTVRLTPRQMVAQARVDEMLDTCRCVKGFGFAEVANAVLLSRRAMMLFDFSGGKHAPPAARLHMAQCLMTAVTSLAEAYKIGPGQFAEAIRHGRVIFRESMRG